MNVFFLTSSGIWESVKVFATSDLQGVVEEEEEGARMKKGERCAKLC